MEEETIIDQCQIVCTIANMVYLSLIVTKVSQMIVECVHLPK